MPVVTVFKATLGQPPGPVASHGDGERNNSRRVVEFRQGNA